MPTHKPQELKLMLGLGQRDDITRPLLSLQDRLPHYQCTIYMDNVDGAHMAIRSALVRMGIYDRVFLDLRCAESPESSGLTKLFQELMKKSDCKTRFILLTNFGDRYPELGEEFLVLMHFRNGRMTGEDFLHAITLPNREEVPV